LFGENVACVETRGDIFKGNEVALNPIEKGVFANVNVTGLFGGLRGTGHEERATIVFVDNCSKLLRNR
jgi:hypothetical protein